MTRFVAHVPRVLLGLIFTVFGLVGLLHLMPDPPMPEGIAGTYLQALSGTYLFTLVKLTEVVGGALLLSNRFVAFGSVLLAPVVVNIFAAHALVMHEGVGLPIALVAALAFTAWQQRAVYRPLFVAKPVAAPAPELTRSAGLSAAAP
jgi:putative oxidoreductase